MEQICQVCQTFIREAVVDGGIRDKCDCFPDPPKPDIQGTIVSEKLGRMVFKDMVEETRLAEIQPHTGPLSVQEFRQRKQLMDAVVAEMIEGIHFGVIPGTNGKSLWEAGAEYLRYAFNVVWGYEIEDSHEDFEGNDFRYRVKATAYAGPDTPGASWSATASSRESRIAAPQNDQASLANMTLDRAIKRAFVNLMKNVTGASSIFREADTSDSRASNQRAQHGICEIHNEPWRQRRSGNRRWLSHKTEDGWCNKEEESSQTQESTPTINPEHDAPLCSNCGQPGHVPADCKHDGGGLFPPEAA